MDERMILRAKDDPTVAKLVHATVADVRHRDATAAVGSLLYGLVCMAEWILDEQVITDTYRWIFALYNLLAAVPIWRATSRSMYTPKGRCSVTNARKKGAAVNSHK